ncbi:MAG: restriction endonuclease subunit S [Muribaculaceae bacterium]|nr:restriction endonuclease subunit S [Muribaculaceae bacterium]
MREGWTYKKLGEVATFSRGLTYSKQDVAEDSSKKVLRSNNIDLTTHSLYLDDIVCLNEEFVIPVDKKFKQNDIFICMSNGSKQHLGKVAFIEKELDYAFGGFMGAIHPKTSEIFPKFTFYYCLSSEYRRSLASVLNGININNIKWSDLSKFPIPIPPLAEQERIVAELDLLSSIIDKKKAQLKELDQLAQSIFYTMFGDPISNEKGWEVKKLKEVSTLINGRAYKQNELLNEGKYKVLRVGNFFTNSNYYYSDLELEDNKYCDNGDLLFAWSASFGAFIWCGEKVIYHYHIWKVLYDEKQLNKIFYCNLLNTMTNAFMNDVHGIGMVHLTKQGMEDYILPLPPLPIQQEFASKIEAIERQKSLIQQSIVETQTLFDSRMEHWFN